MLHLPGGLFIQETPDKIIILEEIIMEIISEIIMKIKSRIFEEITMEIKSEYFKR